MEEEQTPFQEAILEQVGRYLGVMKESKIGFSAIAVRSFHSGVAPQSLVLELDAPLFDPDRICVVDKKTDTSYYPLHDLSIEGYDSDARRLVISFLDPRVYEELQERESLSIQSDMSFLVENVRAHIKTHGKTYQLHRKNPLFSMDPDALATLRLSHDQRQAVMNVASSGLSYVWGPPGTGKTQAVLASCVVSAIQAGAKVIVTAATNKALEQVLTGLLKAFEGLTISPTALYRLGIPSSDFARRYPSICESAQVDKELEKLQKSIALWEARYLALLDGEDEGSLFSEELSKEAIKEELDRLKALYLSIKTRTAKGRLGAASVLAMTLDHYIARTLKEPFEVDHIFLDEAGYAPLLKALTLFVGETPVTMLGDHCQLPPVATIPPALEHELFLWQPSALYIQTLFDTPWQNLLPAVTHAPPLMTKIMTSALRQTHRFGNDLACLLDRFVYKTGFHSALSTPFALRHIHVVTPADQKGRTSLAEAQAIGRFLLENGGGDVMILTPYTAQVDMLRKTLGRFYYDKISTIHKSQGQEWERVIISLVDDTMAYGSPRKIYFTDSTNRRSSGLYLLNTVLSRAKKEIIFVGNMTFWHGARGQLLCELVNLSKPL